jgi:RNA polymerase sigma-70 factor, ECF subfamily
MNFKDIALPHFDALYNFALTLSGSGNDAEDLVQETFLRAYKKYDQFDYGTNIKAWMFRILRNVAIDNLRKKDPLLANRNELYNDELFAMPSSQEHINNVIDLKDALKRLPPKYRTVVLLRDMEGFSYKEIADILSFPAGTVMSRLYRGRKELCSLISGNKQKETTHKVIHLKK